MPRVVLITGVSRDLGARLARVLAGRDDVEVVGVDVVPPRQDIGRARYVRADIRNAAIGRVIAAEVVDTVVHLGVVSTPTGPGGRSAMKEINVIGTMQLLAACQRSETVGKLVVRSSGSVYGSSPRDPALFTEEMTARVPPRTGFGKDAIEIESYVRGLARRRPDLVVTTLRPASLMGGHVDSWLTRFLTLPVVPRPMGHDARLQFLHPVDAVRALELAVDRDLPGTYNLGAPDVVTFSQALALLGRPWVPVPAALTGPLSAAGRQSGLLTVTPDQWASLTYGRSMDISRFAEATGAVGEYSSRAAVAEFAATARRGPFDLARLGPLIDRAAVLAGGDRP